MDTLKFGDTLQIGKTIKKFDSIVTMPNSQKMIKTTDGGYFNILLVEKLDNGVFVFLK